jgi:hypothetical protein
MTARPITMIEIQKTLVSLDLIEKVFHCDLPKCNGACCVVGRSGAPLEEDEKDLIEQAYPVARQYMTEDGIKTIEEHGWYVVDDEGDTVTPLMKNDACAYVFNEKGITFCAIEKAWMEGLIDFRKPVSCHLYPVRITKYESYDAVNYEKNRICKSALKKGKKEGVPLYKFLKDSLIRKYGSKWYSELELNAEMWRQQSEENL